MQEEEKLDPQTRRVVIALVFGSILPLLDISIVNVAIHSIGEAFNAPIVLAQWVITGYGLASTMAIPLSGWATRRFGAKNLWITALTTFTVASILCAVSTHIDMLIAFRVLQGFAAGFSVAVMQTLIVTNAGKDQATRAITAIGLPAVIAPAIAPLLGGLLVDVIGWRAIFLINVPIGIAAIALAVHYLERTPADPAAQLDRMGYLLLAPGLLAAVYGFTTIGHMSSWASGILLAAGAGLIGYFVLHALRASSPLIDVRLFTHASFSSAWATLAIASTVFYGGLFSFRCTIRATMPTPHCMRDFCWPYKAWAPISAARRRKSLSLDGVRVRPSTCALPPPLSERYLSPFPSARRQAGSSFKAAGYSCAAAASEPLLCSRCPRPTTA